MKKETILKVSKYAKIAKNYCDKVVSGKIPAGPYVILACKRHLADLERQKDKDFPFEFNPKLVDAAGKEYFPADRRCAFSEKLPHVKGKWAGDKIKLEPHQVFIQCAIWGWVKKKTRTRRFSSAYIEEPRKNGKSVDAATSGLYMLVVDGEKGAEVYSGATSEKQALEVFRPAWQMVHNTPDLRKHFNLSLSGNPKNPTSIYRLSDMSRFEPLIGKPGDGSSPHCAIVDEYHEHKTSDQYDTMDTGMGAREQPLMMVITTAGTDTSSPCYDMHLTAIKVLEGTIQNDSMFAIIYGIAPDDDWKDFDNWKKANPNYGVSINEDYLFRKYTEAMTDVSKQNINLCKHLNMWTNAGVAWMNMQKWAACEAPISIEHFAGCDCWAGLDLATRIDIAALRIIFRHKNGFAGFGRYYLPSETIQLAGNEHYDKWVKSGHLIETEGARTDFGYIKDDIKQLAKRFNIKELAYDPKEATYLMNSIQEEEWCGFVCVEMPQGPTHMSEPMKHWEGLIYAGDYAHDGDPVMTWMMGNVVKKQGRSGGPVKTYYPTKEKDCFKIDGPVAELMALARAMVDEDSGSIYDTRPSII